MDIIKVEKRLIVQTALHNVLIGKGLSLDVLSRPMLVPSIIKPAILYHRPQINIIFSESLAIISCGGIQINSLKYMKYRM